MKVLVVDDEPVSLEIASAAVATAGYEVVTATNGDEAWRIIRDENVRLVLSDWQMAGMDGLQLCKKVRSEPLPGYVYFILLTGRNSSQDIVAGLSAGADDFLAKPLNMAEIEVRLRAGERVLSLESKDVVIYALAKLAESRDPETGAHIERIQSYSRVLAQYLIDQKIVDGPTATEFARLVELTSPLHDIGKMGIPDSILLKPGRYNDAEFAIMKAHTTIGAQTLDNALARYPHAGFLRMAREIALSHHERYDGTGYPNGIGGETIPLSARIVAVADVYDALTTRRVYKDAFTHTVAQNLIVEGRGTHFDPVLVDAFLALEPQFHEVCTRLADGVPL
ncbi:MAG: response regulator [Candidatus Hydrogenedentes bacterium]|nr:response regulator [Candidatus Hydrogenedentota bacterium]